MKQVIWAVEYNHLQKGKNNYMCMDMDVRSIYMYVWWGGGKVLRILLGGDFGPVLEKLASVWGCWKLEGAFFGGIFIGIGGELGGFDISDEAGDVE